jgi:insertion element IS1 protein InsB
MFRVEYSHQGRVPEVKQQILEMTLNGRGIRDIARVLHSSPTTVIEELKKRASAPTRQRCGNPTHGSSRDPCGDPASGRSGAWWDVELRWEEKPTTMALDAIDHQTGVVLAYVVGTPQDAVCLQWKAWLAPLGIHHFYPAGADVYNRHLDPEQHTVGKTQTQKIERKHLTCRTRLKRWGRKTICFSKSRRLHDIVIGLFVNRYEFGRLVWKR